MSDEQKSHIKEKKLQPSGSSDGVSVHIDSETARKLGLDPKTNVKVELVNDKGNPKIQLSDLPTGFTCSEIVEFADNKGWKMTSSADKTENSDETSKSWSYTFRTDEGIRISIDNSTHIDNQICNNVFISTEKEPIDNLDQYKDLKKLSSRYEELSLSIEDSKGSWQLLKASIDHEVGESPSHNTMRSLIEQSEWVSYSFKFVDNSLYLTLEEIENVVNEMRDIVDK